MITYEQAKAKALKAKKDINAALEYKKAWVFYNKNAKGGDMYDNEIVIMKTSGNAVSFSDYLVDSKDHENPKKITF